jgi:hypothetical protein
MKPVNPDVQISRRWVGIAIPLLVAWLWAGQAAAQVNIDRYRDYFLVGQFGEVCAMCEVIVLCEAGGGPPAIQAVPDRGDFTLYHLQTRTFWSQVSTIWEWFVSNFTADALASRGHTRPVIEYTVKAGQWSEPTVIEGRLILDPGVLEFGRYQIDRVDQSWLIADTGSTVGFCSRLPLWDGLESIAVNAPGDNH